MHASLREEGIVSIGGWRFQAMHVTALSTACTGPNFWESNMFELLGCNSRTDRYRNIRR